MRPAFNSGFCAWDEAGSSSNRCITVFTALVMSWNAPRLPAPSVSWSWSEEDLVAAEREVRHRKAAFDLDFFQELRSLRAQAKTAQEKVAAATARQ